MSEEEPMNTDEPLDANEDEDNGAEDDNNDEGEGEGDGDGEGQAEGDGEAEGGGAEGNDENAEGNNEGDPLAPQVPKDDRTPLQKALDCIPPNKDEPCDVAWTDILCFYEVFGKTLEGEELEKFTKRFNPEKKANLNTDKALPALTEFIGKDDFILMLQSESKVLDQVNGGYVHHAEDFRMMLKELGEELPEEMITDFIREALGKGDDEFDINVYIQFMCQETKFVEEIKKSKVGR